MAFRACYQPLLISQNLTTVFRPGNRRWPSWRGYIAGEIVTARVIHRCGSDALGIAPAFTSLRIPIRIRCVRVMSVDQLVATDFTGSSPDIADRQGLIDHLFEIYGRPIEDYGSQVTLIAFEYLSAGATHPDGPR
ncbi:hypothetical protein CRENPOLYSF2_2590001 [Crenothrix polyspora]|uniref:ASCH domain-containing protein n=2 Tax=Crenothrix polyspora TaxID=360316 RepID=A0A1R4H7H3_9GAMM|nr:hypothetical protein CRENPOLYSF2_2590001 [Crenothrix polyspora]